MDKRDSELLRGTLASLVLAVLESGPCYGYEIAKQIRESTSGLLHLKEGSLYPALHAMEREELLAAEWRPQDTGPSRKYYRLTRQGRKALQGERKRWTRFKNAVDTVLRPAEGGAA